MVAFAEASEVREAFTAIAYLTKEEMSNRYFAIDETDYGLPLSQEDFEYTWNYFVTMREFFGKASEANRSVIFTMDQ